MKKIKLILLAIIGFAAAHFSFTTKVATGTYLIFNSIEASSQVAYFVTANCHNNNWELNKWMSPTNDCNNRFVAMKFSPDSSTFSQHQVIWDSLAKITSTLNTNNKIWTMASNGNIEPVPYNVFLSSMSTSVSIVSSNPNIVVNGTSPNFTVTYVPSPRTMTAAVRSLVTSTAATGFSLSATQDYNVNYSIYAQVTSALAGTNTGDVYLEISPNNSIWTTISRSGISVAGVLSTSGNTQTVGGFVPATYFVRLRTAATGVNSGSAVFTYQNGQENSY